MTTASTEIENNKKIPYRQKANAAPDEITVVVFKDQLAARSFRVPLAWIRQLSLITLFIAIVTAIFLAFGIRMYFASSESTLSASLSQLQTQYQDLTDRHAALEKRYLHATNPERSQVKSSVFSGLPSDVIPPDHTVDPVVRLGEFQLSWAKDQLTVGFNIYKVNESGTQRGRILILVRGKGLLYTYPRDVVNPSEGESLLDPKKGEFFAVSRFREVRARFGPFANPSDLTQVDVLLFDQNNEALIIETFQPKDATNDPSKPSAPPSVRGTENGQ